MKRRGFIFLTLASSIWFSCSSDLENNTDDAMDSSNFMLNITFIMDTNADRLDNLGNPVDIPEGNAAQNPDFEVLGLHFIGLYPNKFTPFENGATVFSSPTTDQGGTSAIDFEHELFLTESDNTISIPLNSIASGTYEYFRSSIGFQQYKITYNLSGISNLDNSWPTGINDDIDVSGTVASFLGFNTFIDSYMIEKQTVTVNGNKLQGYFGLETTGDIQGFPFNYLSEEDAPETTVPNPISDTSPVPEGSCVVTGIFLSPLIIPESPKEDVNIQMVISINNSFEWKDPNGNGKYEPLLGEQVVDMGTRGVFPTILN
ncbi:hypothetical protein ACOKFD_18050 [Flagellimonas sp. S174]|uniref:hypothetical protein n=1 Tax=Flagellimonas sp. S174 TaxID=3410790 RepID=UPI003BF563AC